MTLFGRDGEEIGRVAESVIKEDDVWLEASGVYHFWRMLELSIFLYRSYSF